MPSWQNMILLTFLSALCAAIAFHHVWLPPAYDPTEPLDLRAPPNIMRPLKLRLLASSPALCRAALATSPLHIRQHSAAGTPACPLPDAVTVSSGPAPALPDSFLASCRLAVSWSLFETDIAVPTARTTFGTDLRRIRHAGSFACRDIREHPGAQSSHATADAIDVSGFVLADGREIPVSAWHASDRRAAFLHSIRDQACTVFGIVLSPDYNTLHASHLHLQATGFGLCR